jgi:hypothetical protein
MNVKCGLFLFGTCIVAAVTATGTPASARTLSGYGSFTPWPNRSAESCISENDGAAVTTNCSGNQQFVLFEAPQDSPSASKGITAESWVGSSGTFSCIAYAFNLDASGFSTGTTITFTGPSQALTSLVTIGAGSTVRLQCANVPTRSGIARIDYVP